MKNGTAISEKESIDVNIFWERTIPGRAGSTIRQATTETAIA